MQKQEDNIIVKLTFEFAKKIIGFAHQLDEERKYIISNVIVLE
jgi:hypothetical protein